MNERVHNIEQLEFDGDVMRLAVDGAVYQLNVPAVSERLARATVEERQQFRISPSGFGIHWPAVDEDLTVDGLIRAAKGGSASTGNPALILHDKPKP